MKNIKYVFLAASLVILFLSPRAVLADTVDSYNFTGTLSSSFGGSDTVSGQFTVDFTLTTITAFDLTTPFGTVDSTNYVPIAYDTDGFLGLDFKGPSPADDELVLWFDTSVPFTSASLYTGVLPGAVALTVPLEVSGGSVANCLDTLPPGVCTTTTGASTFASGTATLVTNSAPEPSSGVLMLIGIGSLGLMMAARKHMARGVSQVA
jgi:hypothetical protein